MDTDHSEETCHQFGNLVSMRAPPSTTCFQASSTDTRSCEYNEGVKKLTICTYNVGHEMMVKKLVKFLKKEPTADIVCVQEMMSKKVGHLIECLKESRWSYCARSPESKSIILSAYPLEEVSSRRLGNGGRQANYQFVTVKVQGFYLNCLHLATKNEATRLRQLGKIRDELSEKGVWDHGRMHIFAGDFNSLTKEDKGEEGWEQVAVSREDSNREKLGERGFTEQEEPKFDLTASMARKNFSDCWAEMGRRGLKNTCR